MIWRNIAPSVHITADFRRLLSCPPSILLRYDQTLSDQVYVHILRQEPTVRKSLTVATRSPGDWPQLRWRIYHFAPRCDHPPHGAAGLSSKPRSLHPGNADIGTRVCSSLPNRYRSQVPEHPRETRRYISSKIRPIGPHHSRLFLIRRKQNFRSVPNGFPFGVRLNALLKNLGGSRQAPIKIALCFLGERNRPSRASNLPPSLASKRVEPRRVPSGNKVVWKPAFVAS